MKGKTKQRAMAVVLTLAMTIGLLPLEFLGGGVTQVKAADKTLNASDLSSFSVNTVYADAFTFTEQVTMGPNTKKFTVDGSQITVTNRIKLGNKGDASKKSILFSVGSGMQGELTLCT